MKTASVTIEHKPTHGLGAWAVIYRKKVLGHFLAHENALTLATELNALKAKGV